jgi:MraZ protein
MVKNGEQQKLAGEYEVKVVSGYRLAVPSSFKKIFQGKCVITKGYESSLILVKQDKWETLTQPLESQTFFDRNIRDTLRLLVGSSFELSLDAQGRFVIPQTLREYAEISQSSEVVFVGLINWVEIWEKNLWKQRMKYIEDNADAIAQELTRIN